MIDELAARLPPSKLKEIIGRLDHADPDQAIPQEYELGLLWAALKISDIEIEKPLGRKAPDFYATDLFPSGPAFVEIAAISDTALSGEPLMRRAANIINNFAVVKKSDRHLYYQFNEESGYLPAKNGGFFAPTQYYRRRRVTREFNLDDEMRASIAEWLKGKPSSGPLRLTNPSIDVSISWKEYVHPQGNVFSSMPSEAHDVEDNPLFKVLKAKEREQLQATPQGTLKCIFLGDAGCQLLRDLRPISVGARTVSGKQIIEHFLDCSSVDIVCVFSPQKMNRHNYQSFDNPRVWHVTVFDQRGLPEDEHAKLRTIAGSLPEPYLDGYQARSWHQQGMFHPRAKGQYLPPMWVTKNGIQNMKISARGLQELLAGRLSREEFKRFVADNLFERALSDGRTISNITIERKETEEDDDYLIFEFEDDPAARAIKSPEPLTPSGL
ncbi:hypothetical protein ACC817_08245 [Rhizobium ruizarguesonis]